MTDRQREEILRAMQDEAMELKLAQKSRIALENEIDGAVNLYAYYTMLTKVGFSDAQAFGLVLQRHSIMFAYALEKGFPGGAKS